jgi:D-alanyl-lipoteichoic acid acyltransferase DltB (MBOAT superfamily)
MNFPGNIMLHLMIKGFPYGLTWIFTIVGIIEMTAMGAIAGALYAKKVQAAKPAVVV